MLLISLLLVTGASHAQEKKDMLLHADAESSAEHQGSMGFFREKAASARRSATEHRDLYARYIKQDLSIVARHCKAIATRYDEIAESYDSIAAGHADLSKDGRSPVAELHNNHPAPESK